jgi:hypothetical protein
MNRHRSSRLAGLVGRRGVRVVSAAALVAGITVIAIALLGQQAAPAPPASARGTVEVPREHGTPPPSPTSPSAGGHATSPTPAQTSPLSLTASRPVRIDVPAIGTHSSVIAIGKTPDGSLAVPQPGPDLDKVAWYRYSPTPGEAGPSVLEGHVDTVQGPSIFFKLGALRPGDKVYVTRADQRTAVFTVNAVRQYASHDDFPRAQIFGTDLSTPTLRLITCSNFDSSIGHYVGNTVVFAHLTGIREAGAR